jgi:hypothetical protein
MRCGDLIVDCSDAKVSIYNATEANLEADTLAFFTQIANAAKATRESGADYAANVLATGSAWTVAETPEPTDASATAVFATKNGMGNDTTCNVVILSSGNAATDYATLSSAVDGHSTEAVAKGNGTYVDYEESIDGVQLHAIYGHIAEKKYSYVYFVMRCGDLIVDCSDAKVSIYNATEANLEADTLAFFTQIANALKA